MLRMFKQEVVAVTTGILCLHPVQGAIWADWMNTNETAPLTVEFMPGWDVDSRTGNEYGTSAERLEVNRGYEGDLIIGAVSGEAPVQEPLTVRLLYSVLHPDDMVWTEKMPPVIIPSASLHRTLAEEEWVLTTGLPQRVPVVLPAASQFHGRRQWGGSKAPALAGRVEIRDGGGHLLHRSVLPLRTLTETARTLVGRDEKDEAMKSISSRSGTVDRVGDLPDSPYAYRQVSGIWFTESLWQKMEGREALARRLLLSGVRFSGSTGLVCRIREDLGTGSDGYAVAAGVSDGEWNVGNAFSLRSLYFPQKTINNKRVVEKSIFENEGDLFSRDKEFYLLWTVVGLLLYGAGTGFVLAVVLRRFKGERRTVIWWALPTWTFFCTAIIFFGGTLLLDRRNRADVTEYRLIMKNWPEMHCRAVASAMTFKPGRPEWTLPPQAVVYETRYGALDGWWTRLDSRNTVIEKKTYFPRQMTGVTLKLEAGWFEPTHAPVQVETVNGIAHIKALEALDGVYVLEAGIWHGLGPMKPGENRDSISSEQHVYESLIGLPQALHDVFSNWHRFEPCRNPEHHHPPFEPGPPNNPVVVAWKRDVTPRVMPAWNKSTSKGRVIWVMQCP